MKVQLIPLLAVVIALITLPAQAQTHNRAGVVVQFSNGSVTTRCVAFSEDSITGYDLLRRARLSIAVEFGSVGAGVCMIGQEGCAFPNEPCFCQCQTLGAGCTYWVYSQLRDGAWTISGLGAGARQVRDGDVDGWAWGKGDGNTGILPVSVTLDQICSAGVVATAAAAAQPAITEAATAIATVAMPTTAAPTLESSPTPEPPAMPVERETAPVTIAISMPSAVPSVTIAPIPTASMTTSTPSQATSDQQQTTNEQQPANTANVAGYVVFGVVAIGLVVGLAVMRRHKGQP